MCLDYKLLFPIKSENKVDVFFIIFLVPRGEALPECTYQNGKIYQMAKKYTNIFHRKILQNLPKLGFFGFENIPSDNPGFKEKQK
jgi:hypothetical protein